MSYNNINTSKSISSSDNLVNVNTKIVNTKDLFIENGKLNKTFHNIDNKKITIQTLYKDFCFWVNNHTNLPDCITKIYNLCAKYAHLILCIILFFFYFYIF
jgi:hypothetical protein